MTRTAKWELQLPCMEGCRCAWIVTSLLLKYPLLLHGFIDVTSLSMTHNYRNHHWGTAGVLYEEGCSCQRSPAGEL
jgi:hypothetical protein